MPDLDAQITSIDAQHHHYHYLASAYHLCLAESLHAAGRLEEALHHYDQAVFQDHTNAHALYGRGALYFLNGQQDAAWKDFRKAAQYLPQPAEYRAALPPPSHLSPYDRHGERDEDFFHHTGVDISAPNKLWREGRQLFSTGDYEAAIAAFEQAIALSQPLHDAYHRRAAELHLERARQWEKDGELDLAIADASKAIDLDRRFADAYQTRAALYRRKGSDRLAEDDERHLPTQAADIESY